MRLAPSARARGNSNCHSVGQTNPERLEVGLDLDDVSWSVKEIGKRRWQIHLSTDQWLDDRLELGRMSRRHDDPVGRVESFAKVHRGRGVTHARLHR